MMNNKSPIPVPWKVRWRHWRHGVLPIVCFIVSALLVGWLWQHQLVTHRVVGEVIAIRVEVGGPFSGVIVDLPRSPSGQWSPLDSVKQGDTLALVRPTLFPGATSSGMADPDASPIPVHAPITGCVLNIHRRMGQSVQAFEPIMTISGEEAKYILAYVPEHMLGETKEGSSVKVASSRTRQGGYAACMVDRVGLSLEEVPRHHLPNQTVSRWGVPVRIRLPEGIPLRPGSLVNITLDQ